MLALDYKMRRKAAKVSLVTKQKLNHQNWDHIIYISCTTINGWILFDTSLLLLSIFGFDIQVHIYFRCHITKMIEQTPNSRVITRNKIAKAIRVPSHMSWGHKFELPFVQ